MSKRSHGIHAPYFRSFPSVVRALGPRLVLFAAGCALVFMVGSGTYVLSHRWNKSTQPIVHKPQLPNTADQTAQKASTQPTDTSPDMSAASVNSSYSASAATSAPSPSAGTSAHDQGQNEDQANTQSAQKPTPPPVKKTLNSIGELLNGL